MADQGSGYKHSASDKKLDQSAEAADAQRNQADGSPGAGHDPREISKHDDAGKDRLFEAREQHDPAERASEKARLAKDVDRHDHSEPNHGVDDGGSSADAQRIG
jgi:hypothetical protein